MARPTAQWLDVFAAADRFVYDSDTGRLQRLRHFATAFFSLRVANPLCGRFTLRTPVAEWAQLFLPDMEPDQIATEEPPRYNVAPSQDVLCVLREATGQPRVLQKLRWGLVPSWADELSIGNRMINARGETVDSKPSFRNAFASHRCLIPADGFYEWKKTDDGKQPFLIEPREGRMIAMAGLWEENRKVSEDGTPIRTVTIITTSANEPMSELHDRMPVLLESEHFDRWLDPGFRDTEKLKQLLAPAADDRLKMTPVSRRVNSPKHDDAQCVEPVNQG